MLCIKVKLKKTYLIKSLKKAIFVKTLDTFFYITLSEYRLYKMQLKYMVHLI